MGYLRCEACGAKALSAASTCPSCTAPFSLHDSRGSRVTLKKCSGCGIMHRHDKSCHWCGDRTVGAWRSPAALKSLSGIAAIALLAVGSWQVRGPARIALTRAIDSLRIADVRKPAATTRIVAAPTQPATPMFMPTEAQAPSLPVDSLVIASADVGLLSDSVQWVPAVARTWVNVRSDASRIGDVVGIIKPSEKAMLGIGRDGWRQVKSPDISGWVDPHLFEADSTRIRGQQ